MGRLEAVADRLELRELVEAYACAADARDREAFGGVFTDDAVLTIRGSGRANEGRAAIAALLDHLDARYTRTMHFVGNHQVLLDGDSASGLVYCLAHHVSERDDVARDTLMVIRYHDDYVRTAAGWRVTRRELDIDWTEERPLIV